eukprot:s108_g16.t1
MCKFIADSIYSAFASGRGSRNVISRSSKLEQKGQPVKTPAEPSCERPQFLESSSQNIQCVDSQISHVSSDVSANVANVSSDVLCVDVGRMGKQQKAVAGSCPFPFEVSNDANPDVQSRMDVGCSAVQVDSSSDEGHDLTGTRVDKPSESFDLHACMNGGHPIKAEWDGRTKDFTDGFGLCSPTRWCPAARGLRRSDQMKQLALKTYELLRDTVRSNIADVRTAAFKLVIGKFESSPFSTDELWRLRSQWAALLPDPAEAVVVDEGQPSLKPRPSQFLPRGLEFSLVRGLGPVPSALQRLWYWVAGRLTLAVGFKFAWKVPYLFIPGKGAEGMSTSAELLATLAGLVAFGWIEEAAARKQLELCLTAGTDKGNEFLSQKRSTTKWPLMAINMQLSSVLSRARTGVKLKCIPPEENTVADDITNSVFVQVDLEKRVDIAYSDLPTQIIHALWDTKAQFDSARLVARAAAAAAPEKKRKRYDKSPW